MPSIHEVKGVGPTMAAALSEKGILTPEQLAGMKADDLLMVEGVGPARAIMLIDAAKEAVAIPATAPDGSDETDADPAKEETSASAMVNGIQCDAENAGSELIAGKSVAVVEEQVEEAAQIAAEISSGLKATQNGLDQSKKAESGKSKKSGEAKKAKEPRKAKKAKNAKEAKSGTAIKALKKEVKKRRVALKRQKQKLKQARKALKAIA